MEGTGEPWGLLGGGNEMSSKFLHFGVHLDSSGPPKFLQNPPKILPKSIQNPPRTLLVGSLAKGREISTKCFDFGLHLGSPGLPNPSKTLPKSSPNPSRTLPGRASGRGLRNVHEIPPFWSPFGLTRASILAPFFMKKHFKNQ